MATTTIKQRRADGAYDLILQLDYTQSIAGNYSDVTWYLKLQSLVDGAAYHYNYGNSFYLELNGQVLLNTPNLCSIIFSGKEIKQLATGTIRVLHNADGSKSLPCKVTFQQTQNLNYANYLIEQSVELNQIPRATVPTLSSGSVKVGENVEVYINPAVASFAHELNYEIGSVTGTIKATNGQWVWTVPRELVKQFTETATGTVMITCTTKNGSTIIGSEKVKLTIYPADDMKPTVTEVAVEEAANLPTEIVGFVKGKSKLRVTVDATGYEGSSISGYSITVDGEILTKNETVSAVLTQAGTHVIKVQVIDSRSQTSETVTREIEVADYFAPKLSAVSAYRCVALDDPTELNTGAFVCVKFTRAVSEIGGSNKNVCKVFYKKQTDETDSEINKQFVGYEAVDDEVFFEADVDYSYDVRIELNDSFDDVDEENLLVDSGFTLLNIHSTGKGIGIGKVVEGQNVVDSAWKLHLDEGITSDGDILIGSVGYEGAIGLDVRSMLRYIGLRILEDGQAGVYDLENSSWMLYSTQDGKIVLPGYANYIQTPSVNGYVTDQYGNWQHQRTTTSDVFKITNNAGIQKLGFNFESGTLNVAGDIQKNATSIIPVLVGNSTRGALRFPNLKLQICWESKNLTTTCAAAWGNGYETASKLTFSNWYYSFATIPTALRLIQGASNVGVLTQSYDPVTATSPGSVYGFRPSALSASNTYRCVAIGIGTYT